MVDYIINLFTIESTKAAIWGIFMLGVTAVSMTSAMFIYDYHCWNGLLFNINSGDVALLVPVAATGVALSIILMALEHNHIMYDIAGQLGNDGLKKLVEGAVKTEIPLIDIYNAKRREILLRAIQDVNVSPQQMNSGYEEILYNLDYLFYPTVFVAILLLIYLAIFYFKRVN